MNPFAVLADLPARLQHPQVRDLAWVLCSPPLLARYDGLIPRHPLRASAWAAAPQRLERWLQALDRAPQALLASLPALHGNRLGRYYEELWQFALRRRRTCACWPPTSRCATTATPWASWTCCWRTTKVCSTSSWR